MEEEGGERERERESNLSVRLCGNSIRKQDLIMLKVSLIRLSFSPHLFYRPFFCSLFCLRVSSLAVTGGTPSRTAVIRDRRSHPPCLYRNNE